MAGPPTLDPSSPQSVVAEAATLLEQRRGAEAISLLQTAITHTPANADLRFALGVALLESGNTTQAAPAFLKASRLAPGWLAPRLMLAKALSAAERQDDALNILRQTTQDMAEAAEAWMQRGNLERDMGDNAAAAQSYGRAVALQPDDATALNNLGVALRAQERFDEAIAAYRKALAITPDASLIHANLGNALDATGRGAEAEPHLRKAVELTPGSVDAQYNMAVHFVREEKADQAVPILREIVSRFPDRWDAWTNLGVGLVALGQFDEAEACYRAALQLWPSAPEIHYNLAWLLLLRGQWREGWAEYEWRWQLPNFSSLKRQHDTPAWDGTAQPGRTILLHAEQGLGDTIQFARFAKAVRASCARVILEAPESLVPLVKTIDGIDAVIATGTPLPDHDVHSHLLSLPKLLKVTPDNIPASPYIKSPADHASARLPHTTRPRIGIAWAGSPDNKIDRRRSCPVDHFVSLLDGVAADVISLQTGPRAAELTRAQTSNLAFDINGQVTTWADTAQIVSQIDLIISVDTAVAHLGGAMGKPTWILLPFSPDFRWLMGRDDTPWYPSVRLFRQRVSSDWAGLFGDLKAALTVWIRSQA